MTKITDANKKIEKVVVDSYQTVENTVVGGYKKIEDKFVDTFLKKDGETTEEAKERIKKEQQISEHNKSMAEESLKLSEQINNKYVK